MNVKTISYRSPTAGAELAGSLRETGFAVLSDHPIAAGVIRSAFGEWEAFFQSDEKRAYLFDKDRQWGYFPFRSENAKDSKTKDLKEFYHHYPFAELPQGTRTWTPQLYGALLTMGATLLRWIEEATPSAVRARLSVPLGRMIEGSQETLLRPIHYPPLTGGEEEGAVRAAAHEDINLITLLPAATAPGLQVKDLAGRWHEVPCDPGTVVVNSGDMLKAATGDHYPSTTHRVVNPQGPGARASRYSMALFLHPRKEVQLTAAMTAGEYLDQRLREIGLK
ncbi:MAG: 2OG-Fe(II) oxygenase family protein [Myxococcales bacterium]